MRSWMMLIIMILPYLFLLRKFKLLFSLWKVIKLMDLTTRGEATAACLLGGSGGATSLRQLALLLLDGVAACITWSHMSVMTDMREL
jgi:hypothetical protein